MLREATRTFDPDSLIVQLADTRAIKTQAEASVKRLEDELAVVKHRKQEVCTAGSYLPTERNCETALKSAEENATRAAVHAARLRADVAEAKGELAAARAEADARTEELAARSSLQEEQLATKAAEVEELARKLASAEEAMNRSSEDSLKEVEDLRAAASLLEEQLTAKGLEVSNLTDELTAARALSREAASQHEEQLAAKALEARSLADELAAVKLRARAGHEAAVARLDPGHSANRTTSEAVDGECDCDELGRELLHAKAALEVAGTFPESPLQGASEWEAALEGLVARGRSVWLLLREDKEGKTWALVGACSALLIIICCFSGLIDHDGF